MNESTRAICPECGTERHVRLDGTFRLHAAPYEWPMSARTCEGSHRPAPGFEVAKRMTDAERLQQIRELVAEVIDDGPNRMPSTKSLLNVLTEILDAP